MSETRNPLFIPEPAERRTKGCPKCGHPDFEGRRIQGVPTFTCKKAECRNQWQGGLPQEVVDPRVPMPPDRYVPPVRFEHKLRGEGFEEIDRRVNVQQEFRKGAPVPEGEE